MGEHDNRLLVLSKTRPAVPSDRCIKRRRLLSVLDHAADRKLSLVSAPAGYGKTTVIGQWLETLPRSAAWLTLDEHDSELNHFLRYLLGSILNIHPTFGSTLLPLLSSTLQPSPGLLADALIADLAALREPFVLVFDDVHFVGSEPLRLLSRLIQYLPDQHHVVVITREEPPFPLATWRLRGWLTEIRSDVLRFLDEEARKYLTTCVRKHIPDNVVKKIVRQTEGWPAGIQLAAVSLNTAKDIEQTAAYIATSDRNFRDYLLQEVFTHLPDDIKHFLAVTSVLTRFCAPLCNHLLSSEGHARNSVRIIEYLRNENLFLVGLDSEGVWYRYHNLFQLFLLKHLEEPLSTGRQAQIFQNAGEWFANQGHSYEGLECFIKAGDLDAATDIIGTEMHAVIDDENSRTILEQWLKQFPDGAEQQRPTLLLAHSFVKVIHWDLPSITELLDRAEMLLQVGESALAESRRQDLLGDIEVLRAFTLYWKGDAEGALHYARLYLERELPWKHQYAYSLAITYAAGSSALCGKLDDALLILENALEADIREGSRNVAHLLMARALIHLYRLNFVDVEENVRKVVIVNESVPQPDYWMGYAPYLSGCIAYEKNLLNEAAEHFSQVTERMRFRVNPRMLHDALIGLSLIAWSRGEEELSVEYADRAFAFAVEVKDSLSIYFSELLQVRLAILSGKTVPVPPQRKQLFGISLFWLEPPALLHAEYFISKGTQSDWLAGLKIIESSLTELRRHCNLRQEIQYLAAKALALWQMEEKKKALEVLKKSLVMAEPHGLMRSFLNRGPRMAEPLLAFLDKNPRPYLKSLVATLENMNAPTVSINDPMGESPKTLSSPKAKVAARLTNRELDILERLQERLSNKEIAQKLDISPITVKSHTIKIYRKLQVSGRRQAVEQAEALGILSD